MLFRTHYHGRREEIKEKFLTAIGSEGEHHQPWPLPNMKECNPNKFWYALSGNSFDAEAHFLQVRDEGKWLDAFVYFNTGGHRANGGFVVTFEYNAMNWQDCSSREGQQVVRCYEWVACEHDYKHENIGHCQHRYTCTKCESSYEVDSSG